MTVAPPRGSIVELHDCAGTHLPEIRRLAPGTCVVLMRKLESLDGDAHTAFLARVCNRLLGLPPEAFIYRAAVVCSLACRPA